MRLSWLRNEEEGIWDFFLIALFLKAINAATELIGGILLALVPSQSLVHFIYHLTEDEILHDPTDLVATALRNAAGSLTGPGLHFAAVYLITRGILKLALIGGIFKGYRLAYPAFIGVMSLFVLYEGYHVALHHSPLLTLFLAFDVIIVVLAAHEYRYRYASRSRPGSGKAE